MPEATSLELTTFDFNFEGYVLDLTGEEDTATDGVTVGLAGCQSGKGIGDHANPQEAPAEETPVMADSVKRSTKVANVGSISVKNAAPYGSATSIMGSFRSARTTELEFLKHAGESKIAFAMADVSVGCDEND